MGRLFLFIFILLQSTFVEAESYSLKCDANHSDGTLIFMDHEGERITLAVGRNRKSFDPDNYKHGIYKAIFQQDNADKKLFSKIRKTQFTVYLIVHKQLPAGFILIRDGGRKPVVIDFQKPPKNLKFTYTNFDKLGEDTPPNNNIDQEFLFTSSDFLFEISKIDDKVNFCLGRLAIRNDDKGLSVSVGGLQHSIAADADVALDRSFVRPPSAEPDLDDYDGDDNDADVEGGGAVVALPDYQDVVPAPADEDEGDDDEQDVAEDVGEAEAEPEVPPAALPNPAPRPSFFNSLVSYAGELIETADKMIGDFFMLPSDAPLPPANEERHVIFGVAGWGVAEQAPFSITYSVDLLSLSLSANKAQAVTLELPGESNNVSFTACLNGRDQASIAQFFIKEIGGSKVFTLSEEAESLDHVINQGDEYKRYTLWFTQEDGKKYKLYFSSSIDTNEATNLLIRDFAVD